MPTESIPQPEAAETKKTTVSSRPKGKLAKLFADRKKKLIVFGGGLLLLIILIALMAALAASQKQSGLSLPSSATSTAPTPAEEEVFELSPYANDPEIKQLEKEIDALENSLDDTDFYETRLLPPQLDMKVTFE